MKRVITKDCIQYNDELNGLCETLFHNANGYIGVRGALCEGAPAGYDTMRGTYINGFYDVIPMKQAEMLCNLVDKKETMLNVADTMTISCVVDGEMFDLTKGKVISHTRELDMDEGVTRRNLVWESGCGKQIEISEIRMTSFEMLSLFSIQYTVRALNFEGDIKFISAHNPDVTNYCNPNDPRLAAESLRNLSVSEITLDDTVSISVGETRESKLRVCVAVKNIISQTEHAEVLSENTELIGKRAVYTCVAHLEQGGKITLDKYSVFSDSVRLKDIKLAVKSELENLSLKGLDYYYQAQKDYLSDFWRKCEMNVDGDANMNNAVCFNMYELLQSCAKDGFCSIAAKGMSGEGYEGHYFWDTEVFVLPFFILTNPNLARMILRYRYMSLDKARRNAKLLGHTAGALFPWRTITGDECSGYFVSGSAAYHINGDIAYAFVYYYLASGDLDFMAEIGEEVLIETARLWMDLGAYNRAGDFVLNDVTGPDEYTCMVNNNYYTNCAAKYNLQWAVKLYRLLERQGNAFQLRERLNITEEELDAMERAADKMLLLYDEKLNINPQDDSFLDKPIWDLSQTPKTDFPLLLHYHPLHLYRFQVCKQADTVLAHYMFEDEQAEDVMRDSFNYYEKITTHDSSLSTCVFSIMASRLKMWDKAYMYFGDSAKLDLENRHGNTKHGIHTANMGGCYMSIVNGFAGLRIKESGICLAPFMPGDWTGYKFRFVYKRRLLTVNVTKDQVSIELSEGDQMEIMIYDEKYVLYRNGTLSVPIQQA